jgi:hypothetical protein
MTFMEWLQVDPFIDALVAAALPPRGELEHMTFDAILALYTPGVVRVAGSLGLTLTTAEVEQLLERLVGVMEMPPFRREHYDVLC